jgi:hypothetical protein
MSRFVQSQKWQYWKQQHTNMCGISYQYENGAWGKNVFVTEEFAEAFSRLKEYTMMLANDIY